MEAVVTALAELAAKQGDQIVELSKALAIAHEHHAATPAPFSVPDFSEFSDRPDKLWMTEEEEEEAFNDASDSKAQGVAILRSVGIDPATLEVAP